MRTTTKLQQHGSLPRAAARVTTSLAVVAAMLVVWAVGPGADGPLGVSTVVISGSSMEPTLHDGDLVVVRHDGSPSIGNLVLFDLGGGLVFHRLAAGDPAAGWRTKGDGNDFLDRWVVHGDDVRGRIWFEVSGLGYVVQWLRSHAAATGALVASPFLLGFVPSRRRRRDGSAERSVRHATVADWLLPAGLLAVLALLVAATVRRAVGATDAGPTAAVMVLAMVPTALAMVAAGRAAFTGAPRPEPERSLWALDGVLEATDSVPEGLDHAVAATSATDLRELAAELGQPVLHYASTDGAWNLFVVRSGGRAWLWAPLPGPAALRRAREARDVNPPAPQRLPDSARAPLHRHPARRPRRRGRPTRHRRPALAR